MKNQINGNEELLNVSKALAVFLKFAYTLPVDSVSLPPERKAILILAEKTINKYDPNWNINEDYKNNIPEKTMLEYNKIKMEEYNKVTSSSC